MSNAFLGIVLLASVGGVAEGMSAITMAAKGRFDLSLGIALGSCMLISLFVAPVCVFASYFVGPQPFLLSFGAGSIGLLFLSVLIGALVAAGGSGNWYKGVQLVAVNAAEEDSVVAMATQAVQHEIEFPVVKDFGSAAARALGVRRTPEAVVLDADKHIRYRGRIDDQYGYNYRRAEPRRTELKDALEALLAGKPVAVPETEVQGCLIGRSEKNAPPNRPQ